MGEIKLLLGNKYLIHSCKLSSNIEFSSTLQGVRSHSNPYSISGNQRLSEKFVYSYLILASMQLYSTESQSLYAERWKEHLSKSGIVQQKLLFPRLRHYLGDLKGQEALDLGCGDGWSTQLLIDNKASKISAIDGNSVLLEEAKKNITENVNFLLCDFSQGLPFSANVFDLVLCNMVFMSVNDTLVNKVLRECARILKPNGRVIVTVVHPIWYLFVSQKTNTPALDRLNSYLNTEMIPTNSLPGVDNYERYRRSIGTYSLAFKDAGFLHFLEEIRLEEFPEIPERYKDYLGFPLFTIYICHL